MHEVRRLDRRGGAAMTLLLVADFADAASAGAARAPARARRLPARSTPSRRSRSTAWRKLLGRSRRASASRCSSAASASRRWPTALEWYSAVFDYPIDSGGRPLNSWPAFMLLPFAIGIFGAAICRLHRLLGRDAACRGCIIRCSTIDGLRARQPGPLPAGARTPADRRDRRERATWLRAGRRAMRSGDRA